MNAFRQPRRKNRRNPSRTPNRSRANRSTRSADPLRTSVTAPFGGQLALSRPIRIDNRLYKFVKVVDKGVITSTASTDGLYAFPFALSDLSEVSSFTSIYDQYRLDRIDFHVIAVTQPSVNSTSATPYAFLAVITDYDDSSALATFALHLNYSNVAVLGPGQGHERSFRPRLSMATSSGGDANTTSWIDCATTSVPHFGIKVGVKTSTSTNVSSWYAFARYHISFRNVR